MEKHEVDFSEYEEEEKRRSVPSRPNTKEGEVHKSGDIILRQTTRVDTVIDHSAVKR